jgi:hypothetical protein
MKTYLENILYKEHNHSCASKIKAPAAVTQTLQKYVIKDYIIEKTDSQKWQLKVFQQARPFLRINFQTFATFYIMKKKKNTLKYRQGS